MQASCLPQEALNWITKTGVKFTKEKDGQGLHLTQEGGHSHKRIAHVKDTTGKAIISTTIVLSLGFAVLYFSELMPNHEFGILSTIILSTALLGSVLLLPALLVLFKPQLKVKTDES